MPNLYLVASPLEFTRHNLAGEIVEGQYPIVITVNLTHLAENEAEAEQRVSASRKGHWINGYTQEEAEAEIKSGVSLTYAKGVGDVVVTMVKENATLEEAQTYIDSVRANASKYK